MAQRALFLKTSLTGGTTDALDGIAGNARGITSDTTNTSIQEHDVALTINGSQIHIHEYQTGVSPWTESSPDVIIPDVASTSGSAWILLGAILGEDGVTARGLLHSILDSSTDDEFVLKTNNKSLVGTNTSAAEVSLIKINSSDQTEIAAGSIIEDSGDITIVSGDLGLTSGNITLSGTVDGIDVGIDVAANTDARHAQSHTIISHSDTTSTGSELNTLTDNSIANTLHRHSELVSPDGTSVDPAVDVNNDGDVSISNDLTVGGNSLTVGTVGASLFLGGSPTGNGSGYIYMVNSSTQKNWKISHNDTVAGAFEIAQSVAVGGGSIWASPFFKLLSNGYIGIGKTPTGQLEISTDDAIKPTTNTWTIFSGKELKENIELADLDLCYVNFKKVKLKRYRYKDDCYSDSEINDRHMLGFIAGDIELINPKSVKDVKFIKQPEEVEETVVQEEIKDKDGKIIQPLKTEKKIIKKEISVQTKSLNNDQNIMNMFGTVRKLQMIVESLQDRIDVLESKNKDLKDTKEK